MANNIQLAQRFAPFLDELYQREALTSILEVAGDMVQYTQNAKTVLIPEMTLQGLGDYDRNNGFTRGDVVLQWTPYTLTQDRGRSFQVDRMDNEETVEIAFGRLASEFMRVHVIPEIDAYRFATMAARAANSASGALDESTTLEAIDDAIEILDDAEVPQEGRVLFVSSAVAKYLKQAPNYERNKEITTRAGIDRRVDMLDGMPVIQVPRPRFYDAIDLLDGSTAGQEAGGYVPSGSPINFMIVHTGAVLAITKHALPRVFSPDVNQDADAWKFDYRIYHDLIVPNNKTAGIFLHTAA